MNSGFPGNAARYPQTHPRLVEELRFTLLTSDSPEGHSSPEGLSLTVTRTRICNSAPFLR